MFNPGKPMPPPPVPTIDQARIDAEKSDMLAGRKGYAASMVSTPASQATGGVAHKMLTGQGG